MPPPPECVAQFPGTMPWIIVTPCPENENCELPEEPGYINETRTCQCEGP